MCVGVVLVKASLGEGWAVCGLPCGMRKMKLICAKHLLDNAQRKQKLEHMNLGCVPEKT